MTTTSSTSTSTEHRLFPVVTTDIYPTRYTAFDNLGKWAVFTPAEDGTYRSCREDGPRLPRSALGAGVAYPGELAVLMHECYGGTAYVEIGGSTTKTFYAGVKGFMADCYFGVQGDISRERNKSFLAPTLEDAMRLAEKWIAGLEKSDA